MENIIIIPLFLVIKIWTSLKMTDNRQEKDLL